MQYVVRSTSGSRSSRNFQQASNNNLKLVDNKIARVQVRNNKQGERRSKKKRHNQEES
jgi:hypothetical protein